MFTHSSQLPALWDAFIPENDFLQKRQLESTELSALPDINYLYVLITNNSKPVAAIYFQILNLKPEHLNNKAVKPIQNFAWQAFSNVIRPKLLVAGHLFRHDICSYYWSPELTAFEAYQCYRKAIDAAMKKTCAMAVVVKDTASDLVTYFQHFAPEYILLRNDISMEMEVPAIWTNLQDYERVLKHKYSQRMRKIRGQWQQLDVVELNLEDTSRNKDVLHALYKQVCERQTVRLGLLSPEYLVQLKKLYRDELKIWAVYETEQMVAFFSAWMKPATLDMFYIGFDYSRNTDLQLYFNMLFFGIEQALLSGKQKLIFGRTALDAKARLGCKPKYLSTFLYIPNRFIRNRVLQMQHDASIQEGAWEQRHPFKQEA